MATVADPEAMTIDGTMGGPNEPPSAHAYAGFRRCPIREAQAARHLLRTGRASMALTVLAGLPGLMQVALAAAAQEARRTAQERLREAEAELAAVRAHEAALQREVTALRRRKADTPPGTACASPAPGRAAPKPTPTEAARLAWLRETCGTDLGRQLVRSVLGIEAEDLAGLLRGNVGLSSTAWRKLMAVAGTKG